MDLASKSQSNRWTMFLSQVYMVLFSLRLQEAFWVVYLRSRGLSFATIGILETVFHIASFTGEVPTGWIADRWGRKTSLIIGRLLTIISAILLLKAKGPVGFGIGFAFSAWGYNCHSGAYDALVYDELKADGKSADFTRVMGVINVLYLAGSSAAALAGGFIAQVALPLLYVVNIGVDVLAVLLLIPLRERPLETAGGERIRERVNPLNDLRKLAATLKDRTLAGLLFLWAAVGALAASAHMYGQSYMREMLLPLTVVGATGMAGSLLATIPSKLAYRVEERFGDRLPLFVGSAIIPAVMLGLGLAQGAPGTLGQALVVAAVIGLSVLNEGLYPLFSSSINRLVPSEQRATVLSSGGMLFSLVMMVIFPLIGFVGDKVGLRWGFTVVGVAGTVAGLALLVPRLRLAAARQPAQPGADAE